MSQPEPQPTTALPPPKAPHLLTHAQWLRAGSPEGVDRLAANVKHCPELMHDEDDGVAHPSLDTVVCDDCGVWTERMYGVCGLGWLDKHDRHKLRLITLGDSPHLHRLPDGREVPVYSAVSEQDWSDQAHFCWLRADLPASGGGLGDYPFALALKHGETWDVRRAGRRDVEVHSAPTAIRLLCGLVDE